MFFTIKKVFRTITPEKNCFPTLTPILTLTQTLTLNVGQFSSGAIVRKLIKMKEMKNRKEVKNHRREKES